MLRSTDDRVEHLRGLAGRDVRALGDVRADREERRVEARPPASSRGCSTTLRFSSSSTPRSRMRCTSASSTSRGSRYLRNAEAHHAAGDAGRPRRSSPRGRAGAGDRPRTVPTVRRRRPARACRFRSRAAANFQPRLIASSPRKRSTELMPTASSSWPRLHARLARVVADAAHDRRQRIVRRSARATRPRSRRPRRGTASPGCSRRPGRRGCTAAGGRRRPAGSVRHEPVLLARLEPTSRVIANGLSMPLAA